MGRKNIGNNTFFNQPKVNQSHNKQQMTGKKSNLVLGKQFTPKPNLFKQDIQLVDPNIQTILLVPALLALSN